MTVRYVALALLVWLTFGHTAAQAQRADLNLVIAMDCSWSINIGEYALQAGGVAAAFSDPEIIKTIQYGHHGRIAVLLVHWSTSGTQKTAVPWTIVANAEDAIRFAQKVAGMDRQTTQGGTSISGVLRFGQNRFREAPLLADRNVIDIIADGENNDGSRVEITRDQLVRQGTTINALSVENLDF